MAPYKGPQQMIFTIIYVAIGILIAILCRLNSKKWFAPEFPEDPLIDEADSEGRLELIVFLCIIAFWPGAVLNAIIYFTRRTQI